LPRIYAEERRSRTTPDPNLSASAMQRVFAGAGVPERESLNQVFHSNYLISRDLDIDRRSKIETSTAKEKRRAVAGPRFKGSHELQLM
jgi:hypothetical protein